MSMPAAQCGVERPEGFRHVERWLAQAGHAHAPQWLDAAARTAREAADALGVAPGQIAKSVVFRSRARHAAVLVVTSGDRRVDEAKVARFVGPIARADADFVREQTGFAIGGVAPIADRRPPLALIDRELFRFDIVWAVAGHANGVFEATPAQLARLAAAPVVEVAEGTPTPGLAAPSPCIDICRIDDDTGCCVGCARLLDQIAAWTSLDDARRWAVCDAAALRRFAPLRQQAPGESSR
jgi:prolyl-tRNA editing enzyme YbaK/EbsC (Cys-tRNA(Pro) deacylase)/predicted Fe-S protein YdhL (DUF1289 family)